MKTQKNQVYITHGKIKIEEPRQPVQATLLMVLIIFGCLGFTAFLEYIETGEFDRLIFGLLMVILFIMAALKEIFFVTYQKEFNLDEISKVRIQPVLFGNGKVLLELKSNNKIRQVSVEKEEAERIYKELNPFLSPM